MIAVIGEQQISYVVNSELIFLLKMHKKRLVTGFRPGPQGGGLTSLPRLASWI